jgi:hypothetical protein
VLSWHAPAGAIGFDVIRTIVGPSGAVGPYINKVTPGQQMLTATPFRESWTFQDLSGGIDYHQTYQYEVLSNFADGRQGSASVSFKPTEPESPAWVKALGCGSRVTLSWAPVVGASRYRIVGHNPDFTSDVIAPNTSYSYEPPPRPADEHQATSVSGRPIPRNAINVGAIYDPGGVSVPQATWPTPTWTTNCGLPPAPTFLITSSGGSSSSSGATNACACKNTGAFAAATSNTISAQGVKGRFDSPNGGPFTVMATATANLAVVDLAVTDSRGATVLSLSSAAGWGTSPDNRFFAVVNTPLPNAGAPIMVYAIGSGHFTPMMSSEVWPDGTWGFSPDSSILVIQRQQQAPNTYSLEAHNLRAASPGSAVYRVTELSTGHVVTFSPCGNEMMHFRWTQGSPVAGQADFIARSEFGGSASPSVPVADALGTTTPSAVVEAGSAANTFNVRLIDARLRNGQSTFPSLQCQ